MQKELLSLLDPALGLDVAVLDGKANEGEHILKGALRTEQGEWLPICRGVPCFHPHEIAADLNEFAEETGLSATTVRKSGCGAEEQTKTNVSFSDKWRRFRSYGLEGAHQEFLFEWYRKKLGLPTLDALKQFYHPFKRILEVGPGSGFNTRFMAQHTTGVVVAADISETAFTTFENTADLPNCHVIQANLMELPFRPGTFDFIIADGVLHHTPDTREVFNRLYELLAPGGQFFFYVYRKMGAARQFCDRYLREHLSGLSPEECYQACEGLTELGRELGRLGARITLTKPIPQLGIPAGTHDVQRLLYYNFVKCFWNEAFDFATNNMVNFDWYHPHNAWQHTQEEVESWLSCSGVEEYAFHPANPNGISVLLRKPGKSEERTPQAA